jgi:two-component system sensor histidine kinase BaeS
MTAAVSLRDVWDTKPWQVLASFGLLALATIVLGLALRRWLRSAGSLRRTVLTVAVASLGLGVVAAALAARLMLLDDAELRAFVVVATIAAGFAIVLAVLVARPLADDVRRLETTVRAVEAGDREVRTDIRRADELGHVAHALDALVERLGELERERDAIEQERRTLLSNISHDLRTPLAALRAAVEALVDGVAPDPDRYLRAMQHDVEVLADLVDDLFLLARLDAGRLDAELDAIELSELADATLEALAPVARRHSVQLELAAPAPVRVRASATALTRVMRNLVENAIHHAPSESTVVVEVTNGDGAVVRVRDEGPGFEESFRARAFERFSRSDTARTRSTGGAGLGLAIARGLIEAHGGTIWIEPNTGGGEVAFRLPSGELPTGG